MKLNYKKGFTLIELLVVVAIIGILASIVLVSLNSARNKGRDASAKGSMSSARAAAELYFDSGNTYANLCTNTGFDSLMLAAEQQTGFTSFCFDSIQAWSASVQLLSGGHYCVDSNGFAGNRTNATTGTSCPTS